VLLCLDMTGKSGFPTTYPVRNAQGTKPIAPIVVKGVSPRMRGFNPRRVGEGRWELPTHFDITKSSMSWKMIGVRGRWSEENFDIAFMAFHVSRKSESLCRAWT